jgi:hypothetical protein
MTNLTDALHIPDTQSERDERHLVIQRVGVKDVRYPLQLRVAGAVQSTAALWSLDVALPAEQKGTHMSRFVAWLDENDMPIDLATLRTRHAQMLDRLHAVDGRIEAAFSFFLKKRAPVSGVQSLLDYQGRWIAETRSGVTSVWAEVGVPVKSLCPCSKEISDYGAHNQRSLVTIRVELLQRSNGMNWCASPKTRPAANSGRCSSGPTRSGSPSAPTRTPSSSRTWCATWRCGSTRKPASAVMRWTSRTSSPSTTTRAYARIER